MPKREVNKMTKTVRVVAAFLAILMGLSAIAMVAMYVSAAEVYDGTSVSASLSGSGTDADPYLIANGADLAYFAANPVDGACYKLTNDIVWSSYAKGAEAPTASNWTPIVFNGTFDGNGKTVSGLCVVSEANGIGFFAWAQGTVKNLTVKDSYFKGATKVAGIVGQIQDFADEEKDTDLVRSLVVENCVSYADIVATSANGYSAGIFGGANRTGQIDLVISGCVNYGTVTYPSDEGNAIVGGIAGQLNGRNILVDNCANYGAVSSKTPLSGGIVAQTGGSKNKADDGTIVKIANCINYADISANRLCGGITGRLYPNAVIENCVNVGKVSISVEGKNAAQFGHLAGAVSGVISNSFSLEGCAVNTLAPDTAPGAVGGEVKTSADINSDATVTALGDAFALVDGVLTLKIVATAGQVESAEPEVTEPAPETTEPAPETTEPAPETTEPAPETTAPESSSNTGDSSILYLVVAVAAIAATAIVAKKREN